MENHLPTTSQPVSTSSKKRTFPVLTTLLLIATLLSFSASIYLYFQIKTIKTYLAAPPATVPTPSSPDKSASAIPSQVNWQTYSNSELDFSLKLPANTNPTKQGNASPNKHVRFEGDNLDFEVSFRQSTATPDLKSYYFMDNPTFSTTTLAGLPANQYIFPQGYCDGPNCSSPFTAIVTTLEQEYVIVSFFGDTILDSTESLILASFQLNQSNSADADPQQALISFFSLLSQKNYAQAVAFYGGSYTTLKEWNPTNIQDPAALFQQGCQINGLACLPIKQVLSSTQTTPTAFSFTVEFQNPDGSIFKRGPCCGASEAEMPSQTEFTFLVQKLDGKWLVTDLPIYVP